MTTHPDTAVDAMVLSNEALVDHLCNMDLTHQGIKEARAELLRRLNRATAGDAREIPDEASAKTCIWHRVRSLWFWTHDDDETREVVEATYDSLIDGGYRIVRATPDAGEAVTIESEAVRIAREWGLRIPASKWTAYDQQAMDVIDAAIAAG